MITSHTDDKDLIVFNERYCAVSILERNQLVSIIKLDR